MKFGLTDLIKSLYGKKGDSVELKESTTTEPNRHGQFVMEYERPAGDHNQESLLFSISNEDYMDNTIAVLDSLKGIKRYVGICGGFTQNLFLLGKLFEKNDIKDITLVDKNDDQLTNVSKILEKYSNSKNDEEYAEALGYKKDHEGRIPSIHKQRPKIPGNDLRIRLCQGRIENYLEERIKTKDKYFLYFSNALFGWMSRTESFKILETILHNESIDYGSVVFIAKVASAEALVLEKKDGKLVPPDGRMSDGWYDVFSDEHNRKGIDVIVAQQ